MTSFPTCWPFQNIKIKINHANFFKNLVRISENSSKWIPILEYCQKNTNANYTERYDSLLKMKNHVNNQLEKSDAETFFL